MDEKLKELEGLKGIGFDDTEDADVVNVIHSELEGEQETLSQ